MRLNPIVKKEIRVQARSMRICWEVFAYEAIMAAVFFFAMLIFEQTGAGHDAANDPWSGNPGTDFHSNFRGKGKTDL